MTKRMYPDVTVLPMMFQAATDMSYLRPKGVQSYGIGPPQTEMEAVEHGMHSDVERLALSSLYSLAEFTWDAAVDVSASR